MIRFKSLEHGVVSDAPFVGARIGAIGCPLNCPGCFNQHLNDVSANVAPNAQNIIDMAKANKINQGIIFGGLEWSEQPRELMELAELAILNNMQVMIYTGKSLQQFFNAVPGIKKYSFYLKTGRYVEGIPTKYIEHYDVLLASSNQEIIFWDPNSKEAHFYGEDL